jgi:hypothetical protein
MTAPTNLSIAIIYLEPSHIVDGKISQYDQGDRRGKGGCFVRHLDLGVGGNAVDQQEEEGA